MCSLVDDPMAQDEIPEQDIVVEEQEQLPPHMDPEPEMGAAAAYDTSPPLLHQNPSPIPAETARPGTPDMAQICAMLAAMSANMNAKMDGMNGKMDGNTRRMEGMNAKMDGMARTMREEMQCMGAGLQGGLEEF